MPDNCLEFFVISGKFLHRVFFPRNAMYFFDEEYVIVMKRQRHFPKLWKMNMKFDRG